MASPTAMAAATATLSERNPSRIGMRSRASAAACTFSGTPEVSRPNSKTSPRSNACESAGAPGLKRRPIGMTGDPDLIEVIHAGTAEGPVAGGKAGRFDDVRLDAEAGSETKDRARILGNIGLIKRDAQGQDCRHATT